MVKKLFLTSAGFLNKEVTDIFLKELPKQPSDCRVLMITGALTEEDKHYIEESKQELRELGFNNVFLFRLGGEDSTEEAKTCDIIYICGGNTFYLLKKIREVNLDKILIEMVNQGKIYVGVSAGSIMAGPNIEIAGWGVEGDENEVNLKDLTGFNLTNIAIFPHFKEGLRKEVEEFRNKVDYLIIELTDNQAVFVKGDNYKILGK